MRIPSAHLPFPYWEPFERRIALLIVSLVAAVALLTLFGPALPIVVFGLAGFFLIAIIWLRPSWGFYLYLILLFSLHWFTDSLQVLPKPFNFIPDVLVLMLFLRGCYNRLHQGRALPRTPIDFFVILFICVAVLSSLINQRDSVLVFFNGLFRQNLKFILLSYALIYLAPTERVLRRLILLFVTLELIQVPITVIQFLVYRNWDLAGGTLGFATTGVLALSALMLMALLFGLARVTHKMQYSYLGLLLFIPLVVGEGKIGFVLAPLLILFLLIYRWGLFRARTTLILVLFGLSYVLSILALSVLLPQARSLNVLSSLSYTLDNYERSLSATGGFPRSRLGDIEFTVGLLSVDTTKTLFGYGPGSSSRAFTEVADGSLYSQFKEFEGPYFYFSFVQLSTTLLEYGLAGLLVYLMTLWRVYRCNSKFLAKTTDTFWGGVAWGFRGVVFVFVAGIVYWRVWSTEVLASMFWMLSGIILVQGWRLRDSELSRGRPETVCTSESS